MKTLRNVRRKKKLALVDLSTFHTRSRKNTTAFFVSITAVCLLHFRYQSVKNFAHRLVEIKIKKKSFLVDYSLEIQLS